MKAFDRACGRMTQRARFNNDLWTAFRNSSELVISVFMCFYEDYDFSMGML